MKKAFKFVIESTLALRKWRTLAHQLGMSEEDIDQIAAEHGTSLRKPCSMMLEKWMEDRGSAATKKVLLKALKACKLLEAAG